MRRVNFRHVSSIFRKTFGGTTEMKPPPPNSPIPPRDGNKTKGVVVATSITGGFYLATAFAFPIALDFVTAVATTMVISAWFGVTRSLVPGGSTGIVGQTLTNRNRSGRLALPGRGRGGRKVL